MSDIKAIETKMITLYKRIADLTLGHCRRLAAISVVAARLSTAT
jgi:hypothetical protein